MTRDERRTFVESSGLFDGDTTELDGAVGEYFTRASFNSMFGADWAEIHAESGERYPTSAEDWAEIRGEAKAMVAERGER